MMIYVYWGSDHITHYEMGVDGVPEWMLDDIDFIVMVEWGPDE